MASRPHSGLALMLENDWAEDLLLEFGTAGRLLGHGVTLSLLSGEWTTRQQQWLADLERELSQRDYQHVSEHFGFMTGGNFHSPTVRCARGYSCRTR